MRELRGIEGRLEDRLKRVVQGEGCGRCAIVRAIRAQIVEYRGYYEKECEVVERMFSKYRRTFR